MTFTWIRDADQPFRPLAAGNAPAAVGLSAEQRTKLATLLSQTFSYLRENAPAHPGLAAAIAEMHSAVAAYQAGESQDPFGPLRRVFSAIEAQRRLDPSIPKP